MPPAYRLASDLGNDDREPLPGPYAWTDPSRPRLRITNVDVSCPCNTP